jgi:anti-sigma regulatory factor (Ser/Thr protein kinase)
VAGVAPSGGIALVGMRDVEESFEGEPASVGACRAFVEATLAAWDCNDPGRVAVLLTSEVVTNAIVYAGGVIRVGLTLRDQMLQVEVTDRSSSLPELRPFDSSAVNGRGMWLVHRLARAWGTRVAGEGKVVWFVVPVGPHRVLPGLASQAP